MLEAVEMNGKGAQLQQELEDLFTKENTSTANDTTSIPATYLKVNVTK
jgi:hypothetical protein